MVNKKRCIVTTSWDDGHRMDERVASLLLDYQIKGTFYIARNWMEASGGSSLVTDLDRNFEIGAHTLSHPVLTNIPSDHALTEIVSSKKFFEELLDHEIQMFSFPYGKYNHRLINIIKKAGFIGARTTRFNINIPRNAYELGISCQASNGSPLLTLTTWFGTLISHWSLLDWGIRSKLLFDYVLEHGGIWHLWGHSWEISKNRDWGKLERVFKYVSNRKDVSYLENRQIIELMYTVRNVRK